LPLRQQRGNGQPGDQFRPVSVSNGIEKLSLLWDQDYVASRNSLPPFFLLLCVKNSWEISAGPLDKDDSATAQRQQYFSQGESHPGTGDIWVVLTIPVFLKEVIHVKCSIKYLLPRFLNRNGCRKSKQILKCLWDSLKLKCFTMRLISYLFQRTNNFQSHTMFINLHRHTVLHPNENNYVFPQHVYFSPACSL